MAASKKIKHQTTTTRQTRGAYHAFFIVVGAWYRNDVWWTWRINRFQILVVESLDSLAAFEAIHYVHIKIHQNEVVCFFETQLVCFKSIHGFCDVFARNSAVVGQHCWKHLANYCFVIYDEHFKNENWFFLYIILFVDSIHKWHWI